ncbi:MAG TPA: RNA polymerase sigma factor [Gemmatimonadaceae bacterium]|nr:RNA polymerase sigma factor [Gemmatimonadaceae bacterium]
MAASSLPTQAIEQRLAAEHAAAYGWALHCCDGDPDDAADVLQATYMKVLSGQAVFGARAQFRTWLFGVVRFTALEMQRRRRREIAFAAPGVPEDVARVPDATATDGALLAAERTARIAEAIAQLPTRQREVLHLVFYQECTVAEAAVAMGVSVGAARVHYDRAKQRLRTLLGDGPDAREQLA